MVQLPEYKQFPLYQPSMTFSQVVPKLSSRGRDLLQVGLVSRDIWDEFTIPGCYSSYSACSSATRARGCRRTTRWPTSISRISVPH